MRILLALASLTLLAAGNPPERARDLGIPFEGTPGALNAITDVPGVEVGHKTLIGGNGPLKVGIGPVRTGVTVIFPRGHANGKSVYGGFFDPNGNGEMTGRAYLEDFGVVQGAVEATEEAIVNALVAAKTTAGVNGARYFALPHDEVRAILARYGRAPTLPK